MTSIALDPSAARARPGQLAVMTALSAALFVLALTWAIFDPRLVGGNPVWLKPAKFALSFLVLFGTLVFYQRVLSPAWRDSLILRVTASVMAVSMIVEMGYMILMAAQQQASHFNLSTPFTSLMYTVMGIGALLLIIGIAIYGIAVLLDSKAKIGPALRWGMGWGAIISFALTLITAGYMGSAGTHVGIAPDGAPTLPLLGWSGAVGDIRPSHFLALHAMQVLPLAGLWLDRRGMPWQRMRWIGLGYVLATLAVFAQALAGLPLIRLAA